MRVFRGHLRAAARRIAGPFLVLLLLGILPSGAGATTKEELEAAKNRLSELAGEIDAARSDLAAIAEEQAAQRGRLDEIQDELDVLGDRMSEETGRYEEIRDEIDATRSEIARRQDRFDRIRGRLDAQARAAYEQGPGSSLDFLLGASSMAELSARLEFVNRVSMLGADLANEVENQANALEYRRQHLQALSARQQEIIAGLEEQQEELDGKLAEAQEIYDGIAARRSEAESIAASLLDKQAEIEEIVGDLERKLEEEERQAALEAAQRAAAAAAAAEQAELDAQEQAELEAEQQAADDGSDDGGSVVSSGDGPFYTCPVAGGVAVADDFGDPRYGGGYHTHQGNDMLAAQGTPIVAAFPGTVSDATNSQGGYSFYLEGSGGYIYGAHMSGPPSSGSVGTGDLIGYVSNSGNAQGGPYHLHFEWHPGGGGAVDPHYYLLEVC